LRDRQQRRRYAEYTSVPLSQVIPVDTDLPWEVLGALPEMVQTGYGSLTVGLDLKPGQSVLIRGGTSSVGLAAAALDLVGTPTLPDTLRAVRVHGTACFSGSLSNQWTVRDFAPNEYLPRGVRLAGYSGDAADLPRGNPPGDTRRGRGRPAGLPGGSRLRRPGAGGAGPRRHGARSRHRQARRPRPALIRQRRSHKDR
jgi:hypothetical protein